MIVMPSSVQPCDSRDRVELGLGLGERDVEARLAAPHAFEQELQRERRLAHAGIAVDEIEAVARQAAAEDLVEPGHAGAEHLRRDCHGISEFGTAVAPQAVGGRRQESQVERLRAMKPFTIS